MLSGHHCSSQLRGVMCGPGLLSVGGESGETACRAPDREGARHEPGAFCGHCRGAANPARGEPEFIRGCGSGGTTCLGTYFSALLRSHCKAFAKEPRLVGEFLGKNAESVPPRGDFVVTQRGTCRDRNAQQWREIAVEFVGSGFAAGRRQDR